MTKVYIASSAENRALIAIVADWLQSRFPTLEVIGDWWRSAPIDSVFARARADFVNGIDQADLVIAVYPYGPGTTSEVGYAIGRGTPVIYYSSIWDMDDDPLIAGLMLDYSEVQTAVVRTVADLVMTVDCYINTSLIPKRIKAT